MVSSCEVVERGLTGEHFAIFEEPDILHTELNHLCCTDSAALVGCEAGFGVLPNAEKVIESNDGEIGDSFLGFWALAIGSVTL